MQTQIVCYSDLIVLTPRPAKQATVQPYTPISPPSPDSILLQLDSIHSSTRIVMSTPNTADVTHLMLDVQKNWRLSDPASAFRQHLRPHPADKPRYWTLRTWQALAQISALVSEYRGYVAFQERMEKLWRDEKRVRVNGPTSEDLDNVLEYFQDFVQSSEHRVDDEGMTDSEGGVQINEGNIDLGKDMADGTADGKCLGPICAGESDSTNTTCRFCLPQSKLSIGPSN